MSINQKRNNFKVEIRRRAVKDKIANLRANLYEDSKAQNQEYTLEQIQSLMNSLTEQNFIQSINKMKEASFYLNSQNMHIFSPVIQKLYYILVNIDDLQQTKNLENKDKLYNSILTIMINISCQDYKWPLGEYLPIIKGLLSQEREANTLWLLSNILHLKTQVSKILTRQLVQYDGIKYCFERLQKKFKNEKHILLFAYYASSFLKLSNHKNVIRVIQSLSSLNELEVDWIILESMIDHAPYLAQTNYQLLHSKLVEKFNQNYCKKKKTQMILKILQFFKVYIISEVEYSQNQSKGKNKQGMIQQTQKMDDKIQSKIAKSNYQRISKIVLPTLNICVQNRSPQVKAQLLQICSLLLVYYFPFVDLQNQDIFLTLAAGIKQSTNNLLSRFSNKSLMWQLRYVQILLSKLKEFKMTKQSSGEVQQLITDIISSNKIIDTLLILLKEKEDNLVTFQLIHLLTYIFSEYNIIDKLGEEKIKQTIEILELTLSKQNIQDEEVYLKLQKLLQICQNFLDQ